MGLNALGQTSSTSLDAGLPLAAYPPDRLGPSSPQTHPNVLWIGSCVPLDNNERLAELGRMRKPEWPGIATAAVFVCAGTIAFAIWRDPDGFRLKDWQTFMAACIALVGGTLAYRGAMAKVDLDRAIHQRSVERDELGVYLRLRATLQFVANFATASAQKVNAFLASKDQNVFEMQVLDPKIRFDVDEAWKNLDLFDEEVAKDIATIKTHLDAYYIAVREPKAAKWVRSLGAKDPEEWRQFYELCVRLNRLANTIIPALTEGIEKG